MLWVLLQCIACLALVAAGVFAFSRRETMDVAVARRDLQDANVVRLAAGTTCYQLCGPVAGEVVVLIHGGSVPHWDWDLQVEPFTAAGFRVLRYDQFGKGLSDRPAAIYDRAFYRGQLGALLDALRIDGPVHLVGHCVGATLAVDFAARFPAAVDKLVLLAPPLNIAASDSPLRLAVRLARLPLLGRLFMRTLIIPRAVRRSRTLVGAATPRGAALHQRFREQVCLRGFERAMLSMFCGDALDSYAESYRSVATRHPILLVRGSDDADVPAAELAQVRALLPSARYAEIAGAAHSPNLQAPQEFNRVCLEFLTATSPD